MPKSSQKQIDEDEKKVIRELQRNSKESIDTIAKKCGFSRQKVWRIIKRLEKNKTIWGYHAIVSNEKINMKSYLMLIKRTNEPIGPAIHKIIKKSIEEIAKKIEVNVQINSYLHGIYDWMFYFNAEDIRHAKKFSEILTHEFSKFIGEIHILEEIFPLKKCESLNPDIKKLEDFF
jgi:DNA-binding Lrp family transcriptional regulator